MNLFLKTNFFSEKNRSSSIPNIQSYQLNNIKEKLTTPRPKKTISLNTIINKNTFSPKICLRYNKQLSKINQNMKIKKIIFSAKNKLPIHFRAWNNSLLTRENLTQKEEKTIKDKRIESVLSEVINWDNKRLIENNEQFRDAKIYCENEKKILNMQRIISENNINYINKKNTNEKQKELKTISRYSNFNINFISSIGKINSTEKENKTLNNAKDEIIENTKFESKNLDRLMKIYEYVKNNKLKKKKYKEVIDSTYNLLYQAKKECELSIDLLNERIKALQKYYEAYIKSYGKIKDSKERKIKLYEEKIKKYREYLAIYEEISGEIKKYEDNYDIIKKDLISFVDEIKKKIEILTKEINKYKYLFNELKEQQIEYYLNKLKSGEDTRKEGLSWIVKKLMELKIKIEPNIFPNYLDMEQIEFLIKISKLDFELNHLRTIFKIFKDKKSDFLNNKIKNNKNFDKMQKHIKMIKLKNEKNAKNALAGDINFEIDFNSCFNQFLKEKKIENPKLIELQKKFRMQEGFSPLIKYQTEESKLNTIKTRIRNKMNIYAKTNDSKLFEAIQKHEVKYIDIKDEYFKDYGIISDRIDKLDEMIEKLKKEEYLIFKEKIKLMKEKDRKENFEIVYKALFGNIIFDIESKYKTVFTKQK
jgi:uncharacterized small protein (DUF1192 family)